MDINTNIPNNYGRNVQKFSARWTEAVQLIQTQFTDGVISVFNPTESFVDIPTLVVKKDVIISMLEFCKTSQQVGFDFLTDITAVDDEGDPRFQVVYHLMSTKDYARIRIKVFISESESMPTAITVWPGANWAEREIFDMFGIIFEGHPNLKRIILDQRWVGHPLRKDYPLRGYQSFATPEPIDEEQLK